MDPRTHQRFLEYLETFEYFKRPDQTRLDRESWTVLDSEIESLLQADRKGEVDAIGSRRIQELRRILMRD